ncbi:hypothetical protein QTG54_005298 [Skeletonema marinoi]|uniref:Uncharacterized protein n=1 Tax=Skeletonema marinoi TaxID=267567 RepID=A0AAD8YEE2_9STRA|nr:hypothetical protein QTG54_005298 [Skeletonema marinoi]
MAAVDENKSPQQKKHKASNNDHTASPSKRSYSPPPSPGAPTTAAQNANDDGIFGEPTSWAPKPSPSSPPEEQNDNSFQWLVNPSATSNPPSPSSHSSSTSIPTFTSTSFKPCCIDIPKQCNKEFSARRSTFLTTGIPNQILPTEDNQTFWDNLELVQTISHNQDTRGGEDGQKKPYNKYLQFELNGEPVMRLPTSSQELEIIKRVFPQYQNTSIINIISEFRFYTADGPYHGCQWNGLDLIVVEDILWYGEIGFVGDSEERVRIHATRRMNALTASPHFSGFVSLAYSTSDIVLLRTIASTTALQRVRSFSASEMSLFNLLAGASRQLTPDSTRSRSTLRTGLFAENDTQQSASFQDVLTCYSQALAASDWSVHAFCSAMKPDIERISMWRDVDSVEGRRYERFSLKWSSEILKLHALFPEGQQDRLYSELKTLILCVRRVFSAESLNEARDLIVGIFWHAMRIRQESAVLKFVNDYIPSAHQDISSAILGFVTTNEIPPLPTCNRHGCNNIADQQPDPQRRRASISHCLTCNEPACANRCSWHVDGVRCRATKRSTRRKYCGGSTGQYCNNLHTGGRASFTAERQEREAAGETFV